METSKALGAGSTKGRKVVQLVEMNAIVFTPLDTHLDVLEKLIIRNTDILIAAYPGKINCGTSTTCESRKNVLMEAFRQTYPDRWTRQDISAIRTSLGPGNKPQGNGHQTRCKHTNDDRNSQ